MKKRTLLLLVLVVMLLVPCAIASASYYYVSGTTWLKMRQLPNTSATVLASYRKDTALTVDKKYSSTWYYVTFSDGHEGYVMAKYLRSSKSYKAYITKDNTILRSGPYSTYSVIGELAQGAKVTVLSHGANWDYVSTGVTKGYIRNSYLSKKYVKPSGSSSSASPAPTFEPTPTAAPVLYTAYITSANGKSVNVRRGPGTGYAVDAALAVGTEIQVTSTANSPWYKVTYGSSTGYVKKDFITTTKPSAVVTPAPTTEPTVYPYIGIITSSNGEAVNMRRGAGIGYSHITRLDVGTQVTVLGVTGRWSYVEYDGVKGYIMTKFIRH